MNATHLLACTIVGAMGAGSAPAQSNFCPRIDLRPVLSTSSFDVATGDITGDGVEDAIVLGSAGRVSVFSHAGAGVFGPMQEFQLPVTSGTVAITAADLDGDSDIDVAVGSGQEGLFILRNDAGILSVASVWPGTGPKVAVQAVDTTGDGAPELIVATRAGYGPGDSWCVSVLENDGFGSFSQGPKFCFPFPASGYVLDATAADVDADADADLVFTLTPDVAVALNDGTGAFAPPVEYPASSDGLQLTIAELNGDGFPDLITASSQAPGVSYLENLGNAGSWLGFAAPVVLQAEGLVQGIAALDVDADLDLDVLSANLGSSEIAVLVNDGAGGFAPDERLPAPSLPKRLRVADLTGDGTADLLGASGAGSQQPGATSAFVYRPRFGDRLAVLFDSQGLAVRESDGSIHTASGSSLAPADRALFLAAVQAIFDDAFGGPVLAVGEGGAGCLQAVISGGTSGSGTYYGNAGDEGQPVLVFEGQFRAEPAYATEGDRLNAMAETLAHEIGHKLGLQGHNCEDPPALDLMTCGEEVPPGVRKLGARRFSAEDKARLTLNQPLASAEPKSGADPNDLAILNGSFCVPPPNTPDDSYLSLQASFSAPSFIEFGYINSFGEFVYQGDTTNSAVTMGSHFDGGFDLAARLGGPGGALYSFSNGGGCFTLGSPNTNNPSVFVDAIVEFPAVGATLTLQVRDAGKITGGLRLPPQAGVCGVFCTAKTTLLCGTPSIASVGTPSASATSGFTISAGPARTCKSGILLYNRDQGLAAPFQGGTLCLDSMGLRRAGSTNSAGTPGGANCDGRFSIDMNAFAASLWTVPGCDGLPSGIPASNAAAFLSNVGATVSAQFWGRDSQGSGSFVSDGLEYVVGP